ncbi:SigB/SigF/SigG family RNA polymerase sigma factor [Catellatospora sichuanensis]|uniref:SigB/SigF/SigG family RNA polymerase sigma factor n=1 Tax=Catellatospora sichuanensis TaxID=1969805 RepID=UPI00118300B1|nr:SigB/SigF/SigG family RNA polymerase sigma factor [Catellatospora sichuanensis]
MTTFAPLTSPLRPPEHPDRWHPRRRSATAGIAPFRPHEPDPLLVQLKATPAGSTARSDARSRAIEWYLPMAGHLARRYRHRGEPLDDITQAALIGLIKAVDRFDTGRGLPFASYAFPTIIGEIRRHFRDTTWEIRVPRRVQELYRDLAVTTEDLTGELRSTPSTAHLAERLGVSPQDVGAARLAANAYRTLSLDQPAPDGDGDRDGGLGELLGVRDPALAALENRMWLRQRLAVLSPRDRRIITMRFDDELTQTQIAAELGVSQMHISRLLARSLDRLRQAA